MKHFSGICLFILIFTYLAPTAQAQIVNIEDRRGGISDTIGVFGRLEAGIRLTENTSRIFTASGDAQLEWLGQKQDLLFFAHYNLWRSNGNDVLDDGYVHLRYQYKISERVTWEVFAQSQYNEAIRIFFRGLMGTGPRFKVLDQNKQVLFLGAAYMYDYEQISDTSIIHRDHRLSTYTSFSFSLADNLIWAGTVYFQPQLQNFGAFRLSGRTSLDIMINNWLSLATTFSFSYYPRLREQILNLPANIFTFRQGLRFRF